MKEKDANLIQLTSLYAVYTHDGDGNWQLYSAEANLEDAEITVSWLETPHCRIVLPREAFADY